MWSVTHVSNRCAASTLSFYFRRTGDTLQGCSNQEVTARHFHRRATSHSSPSWPTIAASSPPFGWAALLEPRGTAATWGGAWGDAGGQRPGLAQNATGWRGTKVGEPSRRLGARERPQIPKTVFCRGFYPQPKWTAKTAPALWPGINLPQ